jgi:hypothetical protein
VSTLVTACSTCRSRWTARLARSRGSPWQGAQMWNLHILRSASGEGQCHSVSASAHKATRRGVARGGGHSGVTRGVTALKADRRALAECQRTPPRLTCLSLVGAQEGPRLAADAAVADLPWRPPSPAATRRLWPHFVSPEVEVEEVERERSPGGRTGMRVSRPFLWRAGRYSSISSPPCFSM